MTMKHTPSPWTVRGEDESEPLRGLPPAFAENLPPDLAPLPEGAPPLGWPFFIMGPDRGPGYPPVHIASGIQSEHDARLLSAAPDMRAALRALLDWARENTSPRDPNSPHALLIAASEALAKAGDPNIPGA